MYILIKKPEDHSGFFNAIIKIMYPGSIIEVFDGNIEIHPCSICIPDLHFTPESLNPSLHVHQAIPVYIEKVGCKSSTVIMNEDMEVIIDFKFDIHKGST